MLFLSGIVFALPSDAPQESTMEETNDTYAGLGIGICIFALLFLLAALGILVGFIVGMVFMIMGRKEFGSRHRRHVTAAGIMLIIFILLIFISVVIIMMESARGDTPVYDIITMLAGWLFQLSIVYLILAIAQKKEGSRLWQGFGITVVGSIIGLIVSNMNVTSPGDLKSALVLLAIPGLINLIGSIFILVAYWNTYTDIRDGIIAPEYSELPSAYRDYRQMSDQYRFQYPNQDYYQYPHQHQHQHQPRQQYDHRSRGHYPMPSEADVIPKPNRKRGQIGKHLTAYGHRDPHDYPDGFEYEELEPVEFELEEEETW